MAPPPDIKRHQCNGALMWRRWRLLNDSITALIVQVQMIQESLVHDKSEQEK